METFAPESNGLKLQRGYRIRPRWIVDSDETDLGTVRSVAKSEKAIRSFDLTYRTTDRSGYDYVSSFLSRHVGSAGRFFWQAPELVPSPDVAPSLSSVSGGTQGSRTILVSYAWQNVNGDRTLASPLASLLVPANSLLIVTLPPFPPGIVEAALFATEGAAGSEVEQGTLTDREWTQPDAAILVGNDPPPTENSALEVLKARYVEGSLSFSREAGISYDISLTLEEAYV